MNATTAKYQWRFLFRDSQRDEDGRFDGHSFYTDALSNRVAVKDMSGDRPDETDDGVLWVDTTRPMHFYLSDYCSSVKRMGFAALPVIKERTGEPSMVGMLWPDAVMAARKLGLRVSIDESVGELCRLVTEVAILAMEEKR